LKQEAEASGVETSKPCSQLERTDMAVASVDPAHPKRVGTA
jgi:hypothetical protein